MLSVESLLLFVSNKMFNVYTAQDRADVPLFQPFFVQFIFQSDAELTVFV